jgi:hypothetical protein
MLRINRGMLIPEAFGDALGLFRFDGIRGGVKRVVGLPTFWGAAPCRQWLGEGIGSGPVVVRLEGTNVEERAAGAARFGS